MQTPDAWIAELKGLASDSLHLLQAAIYDERFPELFGLDVYGSIVGMFELNNLGMQAIHTAPQCGAHALPPMPC